MKGLQAVTVRLRRVLDRRSRERLGNDMVMKSV